MADHENEEPLVDYEEEEENVVSEKPVNTDNKEVKKWVIPNYPNCSVFVIAHRKEEKFLPSLIDKVSIHKRIKMKQIRKSRI